MAVAFCAVVVTICSGCADGGKVNRTQESLPVPVRVTVAGNESISSSTNYVGRVDPSKSAVILNQYPGTLEEIHAVKGRRISRGAVVAKVNSEPLQSAYDIAKSTLEQAEDGFSRIEKLYANGSVTDVKMVEIRTQLDQARAAERAARKTLEECEIKAPFSGIVGDVYCQPGEHVTAADPLVQIIDVESVEIHFSVPENEYAMIPVGAVAEVEVPALCKTVSGTVAVKGVTASPLSHAYDFTLKSISDPDSLMPGMVCKVRVRTGERNLMVIPASAVMTDMAGRYVWGVTEDSKACKKYVTVGGYAGRGVIISEGLEEGDKVIIEGSRKVSTGMKVIVVE